MKLLVVVDMQNDFITGSLGSEAAKSIVSKVVYKLNHFNGEVIFTRDTHQSDYLSTQEGTNLPVKHCIIGTKGWQICDELKPFTKDGKNIHNKVTFGGINLPTILRHMNISYEDIDEIELCGLCTDICVISNAMILKAAFPETKITVDADYCAGVTKESHTNALNAMKAVQINVVNDGIYEKSNAKTALVRYQFEFIADIEDIDPMFTSQIELAKDLAFDELKDLIKNGKITSEDFEVLNIQ